MPAPALPREIKLGAKGRDVRAYQRALRKAGHRPKDAKTTNVFDQQMDAEIRVFQQAAGLLVDGEIGTNTFEQLLPYVDAWGKQLLKAVKPDVPSSIRQKVVASAFVGYKNRDSIRYTQTGQRMQGVRDHITPPRFPAYEDCSSFATWCYWAAGGPDPNGLNYNGQGYTGTQIAHGVECPSPRPGDLVFYGPSHSLINHVAVYVGNGNVVSHGQESGPSLYPMDYSRGSRGGRQQVRSYLG